MSKVSYIVPCFNAANFLDKAITSLLNQTHQNTEIIAVDDGSTDNTVQLLENYGDQIRLIKIDHSGNLKGAATARNVALWEATGEYIQCLDADDWYEPNNTEVLLRLLKSSNSDMVWGKGLRHLPTGSTEDNIGSQNSPNGEDPFLFFLANNPHTNAFLYKRELLRKAGGFKAGIKAEEVDLFLRLGALRPKIAKSEKILFHINIHEGEFRVENNDSGPAGYFAMMLLSLAFELEAQDLLDTPERRQAICDVIQHHGKYARRNSAEQIGSFCSLYVAEMRQPKRDSLLKKIRRTLHRLVYRN